MVSAGRRHREYNMNLKKKNGAKQQIFKNFSLTLNSLEFTIFLIILFSLRASIFESTKMLYHLKLSQLMSVLVMYQETIIGRQYSINLLNFPWIWAMITFSGRNTAKYIGDLWYLHIKEKQKYPIFC